MSVPSLRVRNVSFSYGSEVVLDHVSLGVGSGEFVALVGPNGSGKSTLLRLLLGLLPLHDGAVELFGVPPRQFRERYRLGYVPQRREITTDVPATVEEVVRSGRVANRGWWRRPERVDHAAVEHALASVALTDLRRYQLAELSGGQRQRALIAKALASEPDLLLLDEPVAGVDAESQRFFRDSLVHLVREHGAAVLLVSHELSAVATDLDRVVVIKRSIRFDGTPDELTASGVSLGIHRDDLPLWLEGPMRLEERDA